jgi:hypothetical protein
MLQVKPLVLLTNSGLTTLLRSYVVVPWAMMLLTSPKASPPPVTALVPSPEKSL